MVILYLVWHMLLLDSIIFNEFIDDYLVSCNIFGVNSWKKLLKNFYILSLVVILLKHEQFGS